ncbi:2-succinyl-6-hydroxy-2,4-cyclohexadiene-1-carboxylate synthase [Psychromonas aquatilis]|uniref:Putative 2-succinyl-6-hydroxy-2,4-cyclohexadiene-1-carboxylate synthase n=1 Tax=Psychromonas aquatilis TaxID=2005072 RepID=A0ABU9GTV9_9GAMM
MPLYKEEHGSKDKPTIVFLHGFLGNGKDWEKIINHLKNDFHCVTIDLPGHGLSAGNLAPLDNGFAHCHQLIRSALDSLNISTYVMVGYSLGGRIALDYARTQNDPNLTLLILESSHIGLENDQQKKQRYQFDLNWAECFSTEAMEESLYQWYEQSIFEDFTTKKKTEMIEKRCHNYGVFLANMLLSTSLAKQENAWSFLNQTDLPIIYLFGELDTKLSALAKKIDTTNAKTCCFDGLGHNLHQQDPMKYADNIKQLFN